MVACKVDFIITLLIQISGTKHPTKVQLSISSSHLLVLLVFRDQIVHVALSLTKKRVIFLKLLILVTSNVAQQKTKEHENTNHLCELHLVHALASVPVQESLAPEHGGELLRDPLEQLLALTSSQEIKIQQSKFGR